MMKKEKERERERERERRGGVGLKRCAIALMTSLMMMAVIKK